MFCRSIIFFFFLLLHSCSLDLPISDLEIDDRLVGVWYGSEKGQELKDVEKKWEITRLDDGSYTILFVFNKKGKLSKTEETGNWWIKEGKYYERHDGSGETDIYKYEFLDAKHIKFISEKMSSNMATKEPYIFIDVKKTNN